MKLYLKLEHEDFGKVEREMDINVTDESGEFSNVEEVCDSMFDTLINTYDKKEFNPLSVDLSPSDEVFRKSIKPLSEEPY